MFKIAKAVMVSALIGAGALTLAPVSAQADSLYFSLGVGGPRGDVIIGDDYTPVQDWDRPPPRWDRPPPPGWNRPPPRWDRPPPRWDRPRPEWDRPGCSERQAIRKAYRMGLDRPFVARTNRRMIVIAGVGYGGREWISFANVPGCPVMR
ncbi:MULTISPECIES: hypothetical protein [Mesorhizobium]|uniref:hypothetical protein n=1 Tax=Mesorhizobium TaxID=68287 RepID=UPI001314C8BB|nr:MULTISPECIES: hypothetical protein [Mesorhizobium]